MAHYIQFTAADGSTLLVDVEGGEVSPQQGVVKAGLKEKLQEVFAEAQTTFEDALERAIRYNAKAFLQAVRALTEPPDQAEMSFTLKVTGELGNFAVGKLGGDANYSIKLVWQRDPKEGQ